jgi:hypothetical protein
MTNSLANSPQTFGLRIWLPHKSDTHVFGQRNNFQRIRYYALPMNISLSFELSDMLTRCRQGVSKLSRHSGVLLAKFWRK